MAATNPDAAVGSTRPPDPARPRLAPDHAGYGQRLGSAALELLLFGACLGVGWIVWWVVLWPRGESPARSVLHLGVVSRDSGARAGTRQTAIRELLAKLLLPLAPVSAAFVLLRADDQGLWDRLAGTRVVRSRPPEPVAAPPASGRVEVAAADDLAVDG